MGRRRPGRNRVHESRLALGLPLSREFGAHSASAGTSSLGAPRLWWPVQVRE